MGGSKCPGAGCSRVLFNSGMLQRCFRLLFCFNTQTVVGRFISCSNICGAFVVHTLVLKRALKKNTFYMRFYRYSSRGSGSNDKLALCEVGGKNRRSHKKDGDRPHTHTLYHRRHFNFLILTSIPLNINNVLPVWVDRRILLNGRVDSDSVCARRVLMKDGVFLPH